MQIDRRIERVGVAKRLSSVVVCFVVFLGASFASASEPLPSSPANPIDPYEEYVKNSKDFRPVKQDKAWCYAAFPSWTYMPWTYQWSIGYTESSGKWSVDHGYNGAFIDHGDTSLGSSPTGRLDWINQFGLHFYVDHTASKHFLHLWDGNEMAKHASAVHGAGFRKPPVNAGMFATLQQVIREHINAVRSSPYRAAYALDDEISWGHFVHPCMWCVTDDKSAYANWLQEIYGPHARVRTRWVTYEDIRPHLQDWSVAEFDAGPLMDQWTFNDSYWNNFIGDLVEYANTVDPRTPCGFVGGQSPSPFGGYDYAKLMRKMQFIEAYNVGSSQAIIRSFNPHGAIPEVTTHFHRSSDDDIWQTWYYLTHGNRGFIGWVEGWFDGERPKPWHDQVAPTFLEAARKIGPLLAQAEWIHDGIAIYYSHPSIQLGWILDAAAHGKTWINRNADERLGASHMVRHAWENMLRDSGLQYNFLSYADVIQRGVPDEYKVLILPACLCLSDVEARRIEEFCRRGGTVIADYMPGLWDQHGKGRPAGGVLDEIFGARHDPTLRSTDVFGGNQLWCEVDQDANFGWKTYREFLTNQNHCLRDASGFNKAVRKLRVATVNHVGKGTAVLMNLSPQWYNAYRDAGYKESLRRETFMRYVFESAGRPWVRLKDAGDREHGYEITYWKKDNRTIVCLSFNPEIIATQTGGGNAARLKTDVVPLTLSFSDDVHGVRDERAGRELGNGRQFQLNWPMNEAVIVSFAGSPPRPGSAAAKLEPPLR
jgi:hypothetical protein